MRRRIRRYRRNTLLGLALAAALLAGIIAAGAQRRGEVTQSPPYVTPPVHIIPLQTPAAPEAWARYPTALSDELQRYIIRVCGQYAVDPALVMAIIELESGGDPAAVGDGGESFGLMQIYESFHRGRMARLGVEDLTDAEGNILVGVDLLAELYACNSSTAWVLMAYNGGAAYAESMTARGLVSDYALAVAVRAEALTEGAQLAAGG